MYFKGQSASFILQKTAFEMDETGATAAAATVGGQYWGTGEVQVDRQNVTMTVDRPFMFFIKDKATGAILLSGRINNL